MIELEEAQKLVLGAAPLLEAVSLPLDEAAGCVLAEAIAADRPIPPYDRAMMDGYAVRAADVADGPLRCVGEIKAGDDWREPLQPGTCVAIMTGAAVPEGADAVVEVEATATGQFGEGMVCFSRQARAGQHISPRGEDAAEGQALAEAGALLTPQVCGLAALSGHTRAMVYRLPRVALLSTGSEIVSPEATPLPHQIRDANRAIVSAALKREGFAVAVDLGMVPDDAERLRMAIEAGLGADMLLTSGGVSRGTTDLLPDVLESLGVRQLLSGVAIKPGKPLWAGVALSGCIVLALPGNPLAVLVHVSEMVAPALRKMSGHGRPIKPLVPVTLDGDVDIKGDRLTLQPVATERTAEGDLLARPVKHHGSADLVGMVAADGFVFFSAGQKHWEKGARVEARVW